MGSTSTDVIVACVHTASGQKKHAVPGRTPLHRARFKMRCLANVINQVAASAEELARAAPAASRGQGAFVVGGDFNLSEQEAQEAL
ncbi:MAG: hypothetical protein GY772_17685, partial [bacterium]|nr:hypothetical protein [bacterium]